MYRRIYWELYWRRLSVRQQWETCSFTRLSSLETRKRRRNWHLLISTNRWSWARLWSSPSALTSVVQRSGRRTVRLLRVTTTSFLSSMLLLMRSLLSDFLQSCRGRGLRYLFLRYDHLQPQSYHWSITTASLSDACCHYHTRLACRRSSPHRPPSYRQYHPPRDLRRPIPPTVIDAFYTPKEQLEENKHFVEINNKETLAQVFTDLRYTKEAMKPYQRRC